MNLSTTIERARSARQVTPLTILGVLLLPAIIGGVLVTALQNPTERLDSMTAAIVNLDDPVTIDDQYTPLGRQLAAGLVEGSDDFDSNLTWVISNEDDAADGLADGSYQAVVTIPSEFSAAATSAGQRISGGNTKPEQATIEVTTPDDGLVADDLITSQISSVAADTMGTMLSEATMENVLVGFTTIGDQIGEVASGADELATGARTAADGAAELPAGATRLAEGAAQLGSGASSLAGGLGAIASGAGDAANGAASLGSGLASGADALEAPDSELNQLAGAAATGAGYAQTAANDSVAAAQSLGANAQALGANAASLGANAQSLGSNLEALGALVPECYAATLNPEYCDRLAGAVQAAGADAANIGTDAQNIGADAQNIGANAQSMGTVAEAAGYANGYAGNVASAVATLPSALAAQLRTAGEGAMSLADGLNQLVAGIDESAAGAGALSTGAAGLSDGATALAAGATTLGDGLGDIADGNAELASGLHQAAQQLPSFDDQESTSLASVIADPVSTDAEANTIFGPTAIPLLTAVVLWFGGLASFFVMRAHTARTLTSRRSSAGLALRGFWPAAAIGAAQGVLVSLIVQIVASYDAATWWAFAGTAVLVGIAFAAVNQALVAVFGGAGRWISAIVGVVTIATGLISTVPGWLAQIGAALPTAPAFTGLIAASGAAVAALSAWGVLSLVATTIVIALRRKTSTRAVLATA